MDAHRESRWFDAGPSAVRAVRRFVQHVLDTAGTKSDDALLFTSELVSNAVEYADTMIEVVVLIDGDVLRIEVHDGFAMTEAFRVLIETEQTIEQVDRAAVSGRGLALIRSSAVRLGVIDKGDDGKAIWFEWAVNGR